jgi:hypothetical protein
MKLEIELTEEQAACLWGDVTWGGQHPKPLTAIVQDCINGRAAVSMHHTPASILPGVIEKYRGAHHPAARANTLPEVRPRPAPLGPLS